LKIAVHQICSGIDLQANVDNMINAIAKASGEGAAMYFAPEMSVLIDRDRARSQANISTEQQREALSRICGAAAEGAIWVHLGSMPVRKSSGDQRLANRSFVIDNHGKIVARYDKMHLFDVALTNGESWRESTVYDAGDAPVVVETPLGRLGLTVCYDLRFPDLFSALSKTGIDALAVPAAFTVPTGSAHWHILLRARAIEAQAFVIAAAQSGRHEDGRMTYGHSLVVDPWGEILLDMGEGEGVGFVELDLTRIAEVRAQIPVSANRRDVGPVVTQGKALPKNA
jgi:deaminated glutathione amidase